jgi:cobalt/nickel transport system permease protein
MVAYCSAKVRADLEEQKVPLMGVLGAFIFAAQMVNFTIPATGSSGHLGGGLLLAALLGPHAAFLVIASVLTVQALFFADGGLLALGCNIFNLGFFPAFIAYPVVYRKIITGAGNRWRLTVASLAAAITGLELGAFGVVIQTTSSGISSLPFTTFALLMLPIHVAIGVVEGGVTAAVLSFVYRARPELVKDEVTAIPGNRPLRNLVIAFMVAALLTGGILSWFASSRPDGLEWSIAKAAGKGELQGGDAGIHDQLARMQAKLSIFSGYSFRKSPEEKGNSEEPKQERDKGRSISGVVGGGLTLVIALICGFLLRKRG